MKKLAAVLGCCLMLAAVMAYAQDDYEPAKVIAFEKVAADVQHPEKADSYKMSLRLGDTVYNCQGHGSVATFNDWTTGKEVPTKVNGKSLMVKNFDGQVLELKITGMKRPK